MNSHMDRKKIVSLIVTENYMFSIRSYLFFIAFYEKIHHFYKFIKNEEWYMSHIYSIW